MISKINSCFYVISVVVFADCREKEESSTQRNKNRKDGGAHAWRNHAQA
jgi:hypothetical protein